MKDRGLFLGLTNVGLTCLLYRITDIFHIFDNFLITLLLIIMPSTQLMYIWYAYDSKGKKQSWWK